MTPLRTAVISDDRLLREGLLRIIAGEPSFVVVGQDEQAAFGSLLRAARPDVLLMDSRMDGALALCASVKREGGPAVIVMAADDDDASCVRALDAGARGILAKSARAEDLVKAARVVHEGQIWARRRVLELWAERLVGSSGGGRATEHGLEQRLSGREREIFRHAAAGLSNKELAARLAISQATVKAHLTSIFRKLGLRGRAQLAAAYHGIPTSAPGPSSSRPARRSA